MKHDKVVPVMANMVRELDQQCRRTQAAEEIVGMAAAAVRGQEVIWSRAFGEANATSHDPFTTDTLFRIGSVTKLFTATMLMQLRDAGRLNLDDLLVEYLPEWRWIAPESVSTRITFRQVAGHIAGLPFMPLLKDFEEPLSMLEADLREERQYPTFATVVASLKHTQLVHHPGTQFHYSNLGYILIGNILAELAGQPFRQYVIEHILRPIGMYDSGFELTEDIRAKLAVGYLDPKTAELFDSACSESLCRAPIPDLGDFSPAGQLYSTVLDITRFMKAQFETEPNGASALLADARGEMQEPILMAPDGTTETAIGWSLSKLAGETVLAHAGLDYGYSSYLLLAPHRELGIFVGANSGGKCESVSALARECLAILLD